MTTDRSRTVTEVTRRDIFDSLRLGNVDWAGRLDEVTFLSRLYDISNKESTDRRFRNAAGDIWQHRVNNPEDWPTDWVFTDERFDLMHCDDEQFLQFLCEMIHPVVRPNEQGAHDLAGSFNALLCKDGWEITETARISGKPVFSARRALFPRSAALAEAKDVARSLDSTHLHQQITRMESSIVEDPDLAIGTSKELVESICKTILLEKGQSVDKDEDVPQLVRRTCNLLSLLPQQIPDSTKGIETIKRTLGNLANIAQGLAELRNLYGTGHGKDFKWRGVKPRHARLAVGAATTLAVFLFETYVERSDTRRDGSEG